MEVSGYFCDPKSRLSVPSCSPVEQQNTLGVTQQWTRVSSMQTELWKLEGVSEVGHEDVCGDERAEFQNSVCRSGTALTVCI